LFLATNPSGSLGGGPLLHYWEEEGTFDRESLGGEWFATMPPSAVTWARGRLDVFLIGQDRHLYHYWQE
jgi:hypothetical protein